MIVVETNDENHLRAEKLCSSIIVFPLMPLSRNLRFPLKQA